MDLDIYAERNAKADLRLQAAFESMADSLDNEQIREEAQRYHNPMPGVIDPLTQSLLRKELLVRVAEQLAAALNGPDPNPRYDFSPIVGEAGDEALHDAGYNTADQVREASDEDLLAIKGIGPTKLTEIRETIG